MPGAGLASITGGAAAVLEERPRIGFVSLGCPKNLVDSEVMMGLLDRAGAEMTNRPETADILVVNTCSFIDKAKQESIDTILQMAQHKVSGKARKLIVAGCLVERYRDEIRKNMPGSGCRGRHRRTGGNFGRCRAGGAYRVAGSTAALYYPLRQRPSLRRSPLRAPKAICASPRDALRARSGKARRRRFRSIFTTTPRRACWRRGNLRPTSRSLKAATIPAASASFPIFAASFAHGASNPWSPRPKQLVAQGVRELTLIGQDTTCYGEDLGMKDGLAQLLDSLARIPGLKWLRFLYAYPNKITGRLLDTMARHETICKYLDMPLQHASGPVLKSMRRGGNAEIFLKTIERVRAAVPDVAIRSTFITGFPGETEADFAVLSDFVRAAKLDWLGVFSYSDEEGSGAFHLGDKVPARTIEARRRSLMRLQQSISRKSRAEPGRPRASICWSKGRRRKLPCYGRAARSIRRRRSTARSISTTSDPSTS